MSFLDLVRKRQSVRKYAKRSVPREVIDRCIEAARLAPSACNAQPWSFVIVDKEPALKTIVDGAFSGVYSLNAFAKDAPVMIAVVTERSGYMARLGGYFRGVQFSLVDIGIACEHLILQAAEEGLGTCWLGWFDEKKVKEIVKIPREKKIDILISLGYPEDPGPREKQRRPLEEIRRYTA